MERRTFLQKLAVGAAASRSALAAGRRVADRSTAGNGSLGDTALPLLRTTAGGASAQPLSIHPENPKYFLFRGTPLVLIAATEHYGSVVNRSFDFVRYLVEAADKKQTVTRTFLLFRELQSARNPSSPVKPESPDYVAPWPRLGPGKAMDGEPRYDLDQWNPEYFDRLHRFLSRASELGIVVELTVFSNSYGENIWALNPLRDKNNLQGIGKVEFSQYNSLHDRALVEGQEAYARKIIQETSRYDNIYYEICNEPGGGLPNLTTVAETDAWQTEMARIIRDELQKQHRQHLVVGQNAFSYTPKFSQGFDASFSGTLLDAVNVHPLPNLVFGGRTYQLGNFMAKELQLTEYREFFLATYPKRKPCIADEDNTASMYRDDAGWTIHRKRAWMAVMTGAHYDYIDFSITVGSEAGTEESRKKIRTWMRNLSECIHSFDFIHARPLPDWIEQTPQHVVQAVLANPGADYIAYLADGREISDAKAGQAISGAVAFSLPAGTYRASFYSPVAGVYSPGMEVKGGQRLAIELAPFQHDLILRVTRLNS